MAVCLFMWLHVVTCSQSLAVKAQSESVCAFFVDFHLQIVNWMGG